MLLKTSVYSSMIFLPKRTTFVAQINLPSDSSL